MPDAIKMSMYKLSNVFKLLIIFSVKKIKMSVFRLCCSQCTVKVNTLILMYTYYYCHAIVIFFNRVYFKPLTEIYSMIKWERGVVCPLNPGL